MLDARLQARLTENCRDAAVGYANASAAAMNACAQQMLNFWTAPFAQSQRKPATPARGDNLSWFNPAGYAAQWGNATSPFPVNPWMAMAPWMPRQVAPQPAMAFPLMAMSMAFGPAATWWSNAMRGPTFAWPMAYSMMAQGVPDSVAWPAAEANAAMADAANTIKEQAQSAFASYQSAGGFAMAHIWKDPKYATNALGFFAPMVSIWPM